MRRGNRLRDWIKLGLAATVECTGVGRTCRALRTAVSGARIHVLGYHRVVDAIDFERRGQSLPVHHHRDVPPPDGAAARALRRPAALVRRARDRRRAGAAATTRPPSPSTTAIATCWCAPTRSCARSASPRPCSCRRASPARAAATACCRTIACTPPPGRRSRRAAAWAGFGGSETALLLARADRVLAAAGPAGVVEDLIGAAPAATLARIIEVLETAFGALPLDDGASVVSPTEVRALADRGWEIGAHTVGHVVLTHEPLEEQRRQVTTSKGGAQQSWSGRPCRYFAYCNGLPLAVAGRRAAARRLRRRGHHLRSPQSVARRRSLPHHAQGPVGGARARAARGRSRRRCRPRSCTTPSARSG